ncbi:MAG TPA: peptide ABC transporter substrate-binding protein [Opitutaceae bacterium]
MTPVSVLRFVPILALLALAACGKRETAVASGNRTQTLHYGNLSEPTDLDPHVITSMQDFYIVMTLFEGLTNYHPQTSLPEPGVAERWGSSPDGLAWTFHLRADARWSNGAPVTAHDFVYAAQRILSPGLGAEYAYMLFVLRGAEAFLKGELREFGQVGVHALDDRTLRYDLVNPVPNFPHIVSHSSFYPVPRATIEKFGGIDRRGSPWTRPANLVGNGAFTLQEWKPNQIIRIARSETYWDHEHVRLREVNFYPIESVATEEAAFRSGQLHLTAQVPPDKIAVYKRDRPEALQQEPQFATYFFRFNVNKPPLNDARVRRALALAIDRNAIVTNVTKGGQTPAYSFTPPSTPGYELPPLFREDLAEARRLLAEAGFPDGRGFPRIEILYNTTETHRLIAEAIQQMWRKNLGVDIGLFNQEAKVWHDTMRERNYTIARYAWSGDFLDPDSFLKIMTSDSGNNMTGWANADFDRLVAAARNTADPVARNARYREAEELLIHEMPIAPIYFYTRNQLRLPSVKGWYPNLLAIHPLNRVWLEEEK